MILSIDLSVNIFPSIFKIPKVLFSDKTYKSKVMPTSDILFLDRFNSFTLILFIIASQTNAIPQS